MLFLANGDDTQTIWLPNQVMRERARVPSVSRSSLDAVLGYLVPRYVDELPDGRRVAELHAEDLRRVEDGYACGECLAYFSRRFESCPSCGHLMDVNVDIVEWAPEYWQPNEGTITTDLSTVI